MPLAGTQAENRALAGTFAASAPTVSTTSHWNSLHTATPSTTGASEYAGVTRIQFSVSTPASGATSNSGSETFTTSGASAVTHLGTFDAVTVGNWEVGAPLAASVTAVTIIFAAAAIGFTVT